MLKVNLQIDTVKMADKIANRIEKNIENSEELESFMAGMSHKQKIEFSNLINSSVHGVVCHFDNLSGVMS